MTGVVITSASVLCALGRNLSQLKRAWASGLKGIKKTTVIDEPWYPFPEGAEIADLKERDLLKKKHRKHKKVMTRSVCIGVGAASDAWEARLATASLPTPERCGVFVGTGLQVDEGAGFVPPLKCSYDPQNRFELIRWAKEGIPVLNPLWLIKGLSNNVLAFASLFHNLQGVNDNFCEGEAAGIVAIGESMFALQEQRADICLAGGYGTYLTLEDQVGIQLQKNRPADWYPAEGAAFFVLEREADAQAQGIPALASVLGFASCLRGGRSLEQACGKAKLRPDQLQRQIQDITPQLGSCHGGQGALMIAVALCYPGQTVAVTLSPPGDLEATLILQVHNC